MREPSEILHDLDACAIKKECCGCSYEGKSACTGQLMREAHALIGSMLERVGPACETVQTAPHPPEPRTREEVLNKARECVCGQREQDYGSPEDSFGLIATFWSSYINKNFKNNANIDETEITADDVAVMLGLLKVARIASNPCHMDNWVDLAGYSACGAEIAGQGVANKR